ncbi:MAG TPA: hypothetical protein VEA69_12365 [Tepidisphaeraceae bacterium]|nr:hypothetical protein [Tepidisphaeraceae bacterium]
MDDPPRGFPQTPDERRAEQRARRATIRFPFTYAFDGTQWIGEVYATTREEAEMKVRAMGSGTVDGPTRRLVAED